MVLSSEWEPELSSHLTPFLKASTPTEIRGAQSLKTDLLTAGANNNTGKGEDF